MSIDIFCDECEVALDLHDGEDSCESAKHKANLLDMFWGHFKAAGA